MIYKYIIHILALTFLSGCMYTPPTHPIQTAYCLKEEVPQEIPINNEANVRLPGKVKAYAVNRYIDPANPKILHERHVIYRVEEDPHWRLSTDESRQILIGNTLTHSKLNYQPAILEKELALELQRQRLLNSALESQTETLIDTTHALSQSQKILQNNLEKLN